MNLLCDFESLLYRSISGSPVQKGDIEPCHEKTNNVVSEQGLHKPSCTSTEDGQRVAMLDLETESRGIVLSM